MVFLRFPQQDAEVVGLQPRSVTQVQPHLPAGGCFFFLTYRTKDRKSLKLFSKSQTLKWLNGNESLLQNQPFPLGLRNHTGNLCCSEEFTLFRSSLHVAKCLFFQCPHPKTKPKQKTKTQAMCFRCCWSLSKRGMSRADALG